MQNLSGKKKQKKPFHHLFSSHHISQLLDRETGYLMKSEKCRLSSGRETPSIVDSFPYQESQCSSGYCPYLELCFTSSPSAKLYLSRIRYECTLKPILCQLKTRADKWRCGTLLRLTNVGNIELSNCSCFINKISKVHHVKCD